MHPGLPIVPKPHMRVELLFDRERLVVPFLIDTGADFTIVQPSVAALMLRAENQRSPVTASDIVHVTGVGRGNVRTRVRTVGLSLRDDSGQRYWFTDQVLLVDPINVGTHSAVWTLPSLLGRDVLQHFDLHLSYDPPSVSLTLNQ